MNANQTTYLQADAAVAAYDAFIFAAVGRPFTAAQADVMAASAVVLCEVASQDNTVNQFTRDFYREQAAKFRAIL